MVGLAIQVGRGFRLELAGRVLRAERMCAHKRGV